MRKTFDTGKHERMLVIEGGVSGERDVSFRSAAQVGQVLRTLGHEVAFADPADPAFDLKKAAQDVALVIPMVHGKGGEDGVYQQMLETMGKPFLGSGSAACALTFNKAQYRDFMASHGVKMAAGEVVSRQSFETTVFRHEPYVLKPIDGGSSVDTAIVRDMKHEPDTTYFDELFSRHAEMLIEELIIGQEITAGVLGDMSLPIILIVPPTEAEFDYENKYNGATQEIVNPPQIAASIQQEAQELALKIHRLTRCRHLSRTDMIVSPEGELYVLETNTLPGMTAQSLFPKAAAAAGYDMTALVRQFIAMVKKTQR